MELLPLFNEKKAEAAALHETALRLDSELDILVYGLYGLNDEDIKIIEGRN
jgi:hypothetical protein